MFLECLLIFTLKIKGSREAKFFSITVLLFICLKEYSKSNNHKNCENISFESVDFALIEDDIKEVCKKLKIGNIKFKVEKEDINNVLVKIDDNGNYEIIVFQGFLNFLIYINQINGGNIREMFLVTICHELGHIYYDDLKKYIKRVRWSCIIFWLSIVVNLFLLPEILNMIFVFFCWCIGGVMCDIRYC
ncbi:MAG: hypothetical protein IJA34_03045 [Lachnospiraceae bacterium]|nr:hypothetical protein [Lachnospiraceae bacterium]